MSRQQNAEAARGWPVSGDEIRAQLLAGIPAAERRLELDGVSTPVLEAGDGPPVVGLHGQGEFAALWTSVIPRLATTHRVIVPDLPDHGASEVQEGALDAERVLRWLGELVDATCSKPPTLVGHVLGGAIAARFASRAGDRISRLVLVDAFGLGPFRPSPRFALMMVGFVARPTEQSMGRMLDQCVLDQDSVHQHLGRDWDLIAAYGLDGARTPRKKAASRRLVKEFGVSAIPDEDLARIEVPTSLIWGRHDMQVRLKVAEAANARYGWPLHILEDSASDPPVEQPDEFVALLRDLIGES